MLLDEQLSEPVVLFSSRWFRLKGPLRAWRALESVVAGRRPSLDTSARVLQTSQDDPSAGCCALHNLSECERVWGSSLTIDPTASEDFTSKSLTFTSLLTANPHLCNAAHQQLLSTLGNCVNGWLEHLNHLKNMTGRMWVGKEAWVFVSTLLCSC